MILNLITRVRTHIGHARAGETIPRIVLSAPIPAFINGEQPRWCSRPRQRGGVSAAWLGDTCVIYGLAEA
jgi:hypothetical protein